MIFVRETRPKVAAELKQNSIKEEGKRLGLLFRGIIECDEDSGQEMEGIR